MVPAPGPPPRPTGSAGSPAGRAGSPAGSASSRASNPAPQDDGLQRAVDSAVASAAGHGWSVAVRGADGQLLAVHRPDVVRSTASIGKLLLLLHVAEQLQAGALAAEDLLLRRAEHAVADSGLWQHLRVAALPVADLAVLVATVSDNLATNVLLDRVGIGGVAATAAGLRLPTARLLDRVRDRRGPEHPPRLSEGSAADWSALAVHLTGAGPGTPAATVRGWLRDGVDTSMVASAYGADPLAHAAPDRGLVWWAKTGTDADVRAEVGALGGPAGTLCYAVCVAGDMAGPGRDDVLDAMRRVGLALRRSVS